MQWKVHTLTLYQVEEQIYKTQHFTHPHIYTNLLPEKRLQQRNAAVLTWSNLGGCTCVYFQMVLQPNKWTLCYRNIEHKEKHRMSAKCPDVTIWNSLYFCTYVLTMNQSDQTPQLMWKRGKNCNLTQSTFTSRWRSKFS